MEETFRTRCIVPNAVGDIDGKHITMKKPKKSSKNYYNYKGFFALVLLALVDVEYRCLWIDCGLSACCSDAQIFNRSLLREKIEDGSLGLSASELLGEERSDLHYFLLGDDAFALMSWMVKPYSRRQLTRSYKMNRQCMCTKRTTKRLFQSHVGIDRARGQDLRCVNQQKAGIYQSDSGLLSLLLKLVLLKFPNKFQSISNKFQKRPPH